MEYVVNYMDVGIEPAEWARRREGQGWDLLSVADHRASLHRPFPHVWVAIGAMAAATSSARLTTSFVNNLFRSPVEVAQAALAAQQASGGRFELGLGAGWARDEIEAAGERFPEPAERAGRFAEAARIVRELTRTGTCRFEGEHHRIDVDGIGPLSDPPPPLVVSVGGPRTVREVTPHADRVEIKASSPATRGGALDLAALAAVGDEHLVEMIERVRAVDADVPLGMFVLCDVGDDERHRRAADALGGSLHGRFHGPAGKVAEGLAWLGELGITRCQLSPRDDAAFDLLAPRLLG